MLAVTVTMSVIPLVIRNLSEQVYELGLVGNSYWQNCISSRQMLVRQSQGLRDILHYSVTEYPFALCGRDPILP